MAFVEVALGASFGWLFFRPLLEILVDYFKVDFHSLDFVLLLGKLLLVVADLFGEIGYPYTLGMLLLPSAIPRWELQEDDLLTPVDQALRNRR